MTVTRSETEISKETTLSVCLTPTNPIPEKSVLTIEFPTDQVLVSGSVEQSFAKDATVFTVLQNSGETQVVLLPHAVDAGSEYCFTVSGGLVNPETTRPPVDSFAVSVKTGENHWVDETTSGIYAQPFLSAGPFNSASVSSSGDVVGDATEITLLLDLKSSLPVNSKFLLSLPSPVFYSSSENPRCKEHSGPSFGDCLDFKLGSDDFGEYISEVTIGPTTQAYRAGDIITLKIDNIINRFDSQSLGALHTSSTIQSIDDNEYVINSSTQPVSIP